MKHLLYSLIGLMAVSTGTAQASNVMTNDKAEEITTTNVVSETTNVAATENTTGEKTGWEKALEKLPKLSGYLQTGYQYNSLGNHSSSFQAKRLRLIADGYVTDNVSFRLQIEAFNGISGTTNGRGQKNLQVMDAFATMKLSDGLKIRAGQYYLPLGYENYDTSPAALETVDFSDICYRMVCRNTYTYDFVDYGRDLGVMLMGDLAPSGKGFNYVSYNLSLSNGSLPAKDDQNKSKDLVAAVTVRPAKNFSLKGSFNWGEYDGTINSVAYKNQKMTRYIFGAWYNDPQGLVLRSEYGHIGSSKDSKDVVKEDGFYALAAYHVGKWLPTVRYSMYRDKVNKSTLNNYDQFLVGLTYHMNARLKFQANYMLYNYTSDAKATNHGEATSSKLQIMGIFKF